MEEQPHQLKSMRRFPHRFPHRGVLPEGNYFTLIWSVPSEFGGMTTVSLERSNAFARLDRRRVEILTLSPELRYRNRTAELRAEGRISRSVRIRNLWQDLANWSNRKLRQVGGDAVDIEGSHSDALPRTATDWSEFRTDAEGNILQTDRYRADGSLLVIDRQDMRERGRPGGRRILLFDREGNSVGRWSTARSFYHSWLDAVFGGQPAYLISDSSFVGGLIHDYRRTNVVLCQVLHNHFLKDTTAGLYGELAPAKYEILKHLDSYDVVATLTERQRRDLRSIELASDNLRTVSNPTHDLKGEADSIRNPLRGAMIARLVRQKRVDHAVKAVAVAARAEPGLTVDVYGEGRGRMKLETLADDLGADKAIVFHGHTAGAKREFLDASFSILTSLFEGQGLVLLESMSAGCIPISYDIAYGPSDIIEHGTNGFLVPDGDVEAFAATIVKVMRMDDDNLRTLRENALTRAADFFEAPIVERWGEVLGQQRFNRVGKLPQCKAHATFGQITQQEISLTVSLSNSTNTVDGQVYLVWQSRQRHHFGRCSMHQVENGFSVTMPTERLSFITPGLIDFYVDIVKGRDFQRVRVSSQEQNLVNAYPRVKLYPTSHGSLSARVFEADQPEDRGSPDSRAS